MKSLKFLKIWLLILLLPAFLNAQNDNYVKWNLKGKVKSIKESSFKVREISTGFIKDSLEYYYLNEFNTFGNKTVDTKYNSSGKAEKNYTYKIDNENRRIEQDQYNADGKLSRIITYKYDTKGNIAEDNSVDAAGKPEKKMTYVYDDKGNVIEDNSYNAEGKLLKKFVYKLDENGNRTQTQKYNADGTPDKKIICSYDTQNNIISESFFKADGSASGKNTYTYKYDAQNNWIQKTTLIDGKTISILEREIVYF
jgi:hypothetical protein